MKMKISSLTLTHQPPGGFFLFLSVEGVRVREPERVPGNPGLQLLDPAKYPDVEEDEEREGDDDLHDEVHPQDVDSDIGRVGPHVGRLDGVYGLPAAKAFPAVVVLLWTDGGHADLQELGHVVGEGEDGDGDDEGPARVLSPENR